MAVTTWEELNKKGRKGENERGKDGDHWCCIKIQHGCEVQVIFVRGGVKQASMHIHVEATYHHRLRQDLSVRWKLPFA